ncbi:MAG: NADH-ubiquinone oxidoreductase-F iron-sulfur binding region domain-containing protein [Oryzihumus sp.]
MTTQVRLTRPDGQRLTVAQGPRLLAHVADGPGLDAHLRHHGPPPRPGLQVLGEALRLADVRGRGGAGFPFARKVETAAVSRGRAIVVVNLSEGEPASAKDAALALVAPHLVLDGAAAVAHALGTREVHVVVPGEHVDVASSVHRAVAERSGVDRRPRWQLHTAAPRFVAGQAWAVLELLAGRENLPVTAWQPESRRGHKGRPTLLSNAETFAQVATLLRLGAPAYGALGTVEEPGTCLLTVDGDTPAPRVVEVAHGTPWRSVLGAATAGPVLLGGYHGTWAAPGALTGLTVTRAAMARHGLALGAGVVLPLADDDCPVEVTAAVVGYLAGQSAGRCGPCSNGLPALADAVTRMAAGDEAALARVQELAGVVVGRGACAHPDGTVRLVGSLLTAYGDEVTAHLTDGCTMGRAERRAG